MQISIQIVNCANNIINGHTNYHGSTLWFARQRKCFSSSQSERFVQLKLIRMSQENTGPENPPDDLLDNSTAEYSSVKCESGNIASSLPQNTKQDETNTVVSEDTSTGLSTAGNDDLESNSKRSISFISDSTDNSYTTVEGKEKGTDQAVDIEHDGSHVGNQAPGEHPMLQSVKYLEKHHILRLFQNLAAQIVYQRPDSPLQFLVDELERSRGETGELSEDQKAGPDLLA